MKCLRFRLPCMTLLLLFAEGGTNWSLMAQAQSKEAI